jgi:methionine-S-sulfoxide reductase
MPTATGPWPVLTLVGFLLLACSQPDANATRTPPATMTDAPASTAIATFGNGCFWCSEAVLEQLDGVLDVVSGYTGGNVSNPSYEQVWSGRTGHAEAVQVTFDPKRISYAALCDWFFKSHDPTTKDQQGPDVGTQYRSVIFYHDEAQHQEALAAIERAQPHWVNPIVTELSPATTFWPAEAYHQDYARTHAAAYQMYRIGCGRDASLKAAWR